MRVVLFTGQWAKIRINRTFSFSNGFLTFILIKDVVFVEIEKVIQRKGNGDKYFR